MQTMRKSFYRYVIPSMLAFALSGIYSIADGFFVGNSLGDNALAAINIAYPITALIQALGTGIGMGGAVQYAICLGSGNASGKNRYFTGALLLLLLFSAAATVGFSLSFPVILRAFGAQGEILRYAEEYLRIIIYGSVFQVLGTGFVPFIRNMGGSITAMAAMIAGFVTNIVLDYLFVWRLPFGMAGAALATVIGQTVTFAVCLGFVLWKKQPLFSRLGKDAAQMVKRILLTAISPFGLTFSPNLTLILVNKSASLCGGEAAVTCYAAISYISCVVLLLLQGVSDGIQPLISLTYGEGELPRTKQLRNMACRFALIVAAVCMGALFFNGGEIAQIFGASPETIARVDTVMPIFVTGYLFAAVSRITVSYFYATEKNVWAYLLIYGEPLALLLLLLFLPAIAGITGTWVSVPVSQAIAAALSFFLLWLGRRRTAEVTPSVTAGRENPPAAS